MTASAPGATGWAADRSDVQRCPRLVYVMGAGRSGSTVLGILLGNVPDVFYGGELMAWNHFRGVPITERADVDAFWRAVAEAVPHRAEHHRTDFFPVLEHHRALLRPRRLLDPVLRTRHERQNRELLAAVAAVSGCGTIVDTSHFPTRAWLLSRLRYLDVHVIHLVRDPSAVVAALRTPVQRQRPMGALQANLYCVGVALLSSAVLAALPRSRRTVLRYEDLVRDPRAVLADLGRFLDLDVSGVDPDDLVVGPVFQGNRVRHRERLSIRAVPSRDEGRRRDLGASVTAIVQVPVRLAYGYLGPGRAPKRRRSGGRADAARPASRADRRVRVP